MKIHFITFANNDSNFSQERIVHEAKMMGVFDKTTFYTEKDFDEEFLKRMGEKIKTYKRGYGYWSWKPYVIMKELKIISEGDVIVYADAGCSFILKNKENLNKWIDIVKKSNSGVLCPCYGPYTEYEWTKYDLYDYINKTYNKDNKEIFENTLQRCATVILFCKKEKSIDLVNQWYDVVTNHFNLCNDEISKLPNHKDFKEHRHDQSAFSLLSKIYDIDVIESLNGGIMDCENTPIYPSRIRNDKYTWKKNGI